MSDMDTVKGKLVGGWMMENLPRDRMDLLWDEVRNTCGLSGPEVSFLKLILRRHKFLDVSSVHHSLDPQMIDRISSSVLCLQDGIEVVGTAIVWDYTDTNEILILTNYHTWNVEKFRYCFPPPPSENQKSSKKRKKGADSDPVTLKLCGENGFDYEFVLTSALFYKCHEAEDFVVLKLPKKGFTTSRILVSLVVSLTERIHAFGYICHTKQFKISRGEVSEMIPKGFVMNVLSPGGFSGAAVLVDGVGRAIGYMGGNLDKNSQHQSYAFKFDHVIVATGRKESPCNSPSKK